MEGGRGREGGNVCGGIKVLSLVLSTHLLRPNIFGGLASSNSLINKLREKCAVVAKRASCLMRWFSGHSYMHANHHLIETYLSS